MENVDLYGVLGVARDADAAAIRAAFREKSKLYHPDSTSEEKSKEMFNQITLAKRILLNPAHRANYDAVGAVPPDEADNEDAQIKGALASMFQQVASGMIKANRSPAREDILGELHNAIAAQFQTVNTTITQLEHSRAKLVEMQGRFRIKSLEQPNHLEDVVRGQLELIDRQIAQSRGALRTLEQGRLYLNDVSYDRNTPAPMAIA